MEELLNNAPCGFASVADDGQLLTINTTLLEMLGYERADLIGRHLQTLFSPGASVFYQTHVFPLLKLQGKVDEIYLALRSQAGDEVPVLVNAVRSERDGAFVNDCIFVAMRQRSRYEDAILRAKKQAESAIKERENAYADLAKTYAALESANTELETRQATLVELNVQLAARVERQALLNQISQALRTQSDADAILRHAVRRLADLLGTDRCYFVEYDLHRDWAKVLSDWHRPDLSTLRGVYHVSDFDVDIVALFGHRGLLVVQDIYEADILPTPKAVSSRAALGMRSEVGVAVYEGIVPVASLHVAMANAPRAWSEDEIELVQSVATLTRTAVQEARLHERERRIAEQLQDALLPSLPIFPGLAIDVHYRPALDEAAIGGDFYDVFALSNGCYAIVVADVSGKGLEAAKQIAAIRHMLRAGLYQPDVTIAEAVTSLSNMLIDHDLLTGFATLFVGAYDATLYTLTYVNAGQEPGLVYRETEREVVELGPTGPILGGIAGATFAERTIALSPGDVFALFTDGLTEAGADRKDLLGMNGMTRIFFESARAADAGSPQRPDDVAAQMMRRVEAEVTTAGIRDDVCLLVACVP